MRKCFFSQWKIFQELKQAAQEGGRVTVPGSDQECGIQCYGLVWWCSAKGWTQLSRRPFPTLMIL